MIFGYSEMVSMIEAKNPGFTYYSAALPQIKGSDDPKTTAYYWIEVVSKHSQYKNQAWTLLDFISEQQQLSKYRSATKRPPSRKDMIEAASGDAKYGAFAAQLNTATTWYKGKQPYKVYDIFATMINGVVSGQKAQNTIDSARNAVTALLQKEKED
jgi:maltose-binding protein MalE